MNKKFYKNKKGITLIALVITIIVLLLLAGVSISMLSGQDGILDKAASAKDATSESENYDKVALAVQEALVNGLGKVDLEGTGDGSLKESLDNAGITGYTGNGVIEYKGKTYIVSENGTVGTKKFTAANYGDLVNYNVDIDGDTTNADWQVFYDDGTNVYLIAKDFVQLDDATKTATNILTNGYYVWWASNTLAYPESTANVITKHEKFNGLLTSGYNNAKGVAQLLNKTNWESFKDSEGKSEYVIGGPTLELFVKSYNDKYASKKIEYIEDTYGYKLKWQDVGEPDFYVSGLETSDNMYVSPRNGIHYLLASPCMPTSDVLVSMGTSLGFQDFYYIYDTFGIRPLVCLNTDVQFKKVGDVWNIK